MEPIDVPAMGDFLENFPADGKITMSGGQEGIAYDAIGAGLIERAETKSPCKTCGTPRVDYSYFRITSAGRYFLAAFRARQDTPDAR